MIDDILDFQFLEMCSSLQLLDACTDKLGLVSAARKLFLSDGTPVTHPRQLSRDVDVYVSCGEAFRDPYASILGSDKLFIPLKFKIFLELEGAKQFTLDQFLGVMNLHLKHWVKRKEKKF